MCIEYAKDILAYRIEHEVHVYLIIAGIYILVILWFLRSVRNAADKKEAYDTKVRMYMLVFLLILSVCAAGHDVLSAVNDYRNNNIVCNEGIYVNRRNFKPTMFGLIVEFTIDDETIKLETYCEDEAEFPDGVYSATACYTENSRILLCLYDLKEIKMDDQS